jgi:RimJ/RimL family protein N-acetyltransferase
MMSLTLVAPSDAEAYAGVVSSIHPDEKFDPDVVRARWRDESAHPQDQARYLIVDEGSVCGLAFWSLVEGVDLGQLRLANVNVRMTPSNESNESFGWIMKRMEREARQAGAGVARAVTREDEPFHRSMLLRQGYSVDRVSRSWRLDLVKRRHDLLDARSRSRKLMSASGFMINTVASAEDDDTWHRLYELTIETIPDIPTTIPEPVPSLEAWLSKMRSPDTHEDRIWAAWTDGQLAGYSYLTYPQAGDVWTGYTATRMEHRRRGVARAVKLETIGQAVELGITSIRTNNDIENVAILHTNEALGYEPLPGLITHAKTLI